MEHEENEKSLKDKYNLLKNKYNFKFTKSEPRFKKVEKSENRKLYLKYLNDRSYHSRLSPEEIADVMMELQRFLDHDPTCDQSELFELINTLEWVGNKDKRPEYIALLEKFLDYRENSTGPVEALSVLCRDWDLTSHYADKIKSFIKGVEWDEGNVKLRALCIAGDLVQETYDTECLKCLFSILENKHEVTQYRKVAFKSICIAIGIEWNDLPKIVDPDHLTDHDKEIIEKARQIYGA